MSQPLSLQDRADIADLVARYCWALDTGDAEAYVATFLEDGEFEHVPNAPLRGPDEIRSMLEYVWYDRPGWYVGRQHHASNLLIAGDSERTSVKGYWQQLQWEQDPRGRVTMGWLGHWDNIAVKRDGAWYWQRVLVVPWQQGNLPWLGEERAYYTFAPPGSLAVR